jgi:hypothetical protein
MPRCAIASSSSQGAAWDYLANGVSGGFHQ